MRFSRLVALGLVLALGIGMVAAVFTAPASAQMQVYIRVAPPAPVYEHPGGKPGVNYVWDPGHYQWTGHAYRWVGGHWIYAPMRAQGKHWIPGHWNHGARGWWWVNGHWS